MPSWMKTMFSLILRFGMSAGLLWLVFIHIEDKKRIADLIGTSDILYIGYASIFFITIHAILLLRWRIFIRAFGLDIPWLNLARYFFLGLFGNLFLPTAIGGDVIKTVGLCVNSVQKQKVVASVLLDRLSGFASMVLIAVGCLAAGFGYFQNPVIWLTVLMMGAVLAVIWAVLLNERLYGWFCHVFHFFPSLKAAVMQVHYDIKLLKGSTRVFVQAIAVSCLSQIALALSFFLLSKAMHQTIPMFYFLIVTPIACVASSFPSIGGLGFREGALEYLLSHVGVIAGIGAGLGLLNFFFMVAVGVLGGIFFLMTKNRHVQGR